ncbi:hypothetical protein N0V90_009299 [Kalmusia sp. IMI 367209]|nr:hypothetical protein N0V90_009299 [Kalmusia sp. IMI 367209]
MAANYSYDRLPALHESQDIAEYVDTAWRVGDSPGHDEIQFDLQEQSNPSLPSYTTLERRETADRSSLSSFNTVHTSSSSTTSSGLRKLKNGWEKGISRVRRKPLPRYMQGSIRKHPAAEIEPTKIKRGVWKDQLLIDRSLRGMSLLMSLFAIGMIIVIATNAEAFGARINKFTSSVGGDTQDCKDVTNTNTALLLVINIGATMVLGMSNTYQQLITSLKTSDLKYMLEKFGDSRVGTNSPWNINHKKEGKGKAWAAWLLLVCTSLPIHFLANSLIGPSYIVEPPSKVEFNATSYAALSTTRYSSYTGYPISSASSFLCWSAFRTGRASFARSTAIMQGDLDRTHQNGLVYSKIKISYSTDNCTGLANTWDDINSLEETVNIDQYNQLTYVAGKDDDCVNAGSVICTMGEQKPAQCRLNSKDESKTGEEVGHCQKCKKWNSVNRFVNEIQPTIATKIKRSLISNLGNTALTQMSIMIFCSIVMVSASIAIAVPLGMSNQAEKEACSGGSSYSYGEDDLCRMSSGERFAKISGGWGGFNRSLPVAALSPDNGSNEVLSFLISNGAQFIYSLLYLLLIYNITLVSQEYDWGKLEHERARLRCTTVIGESFEQDYLLQLPKKILFPIMTYSILTHWMLGEALQTQETIWSDKSKDLGRYVEHSMYTITYAAYPLWLAAFLILVMTSGCWWAFGYRREGVIPQMFGSIRVLCAATTQLDDFPVTGVKWGDLGMGKQFRHAGLSSEEVQTIIPNELYAGVGGEDKRDKSDILGEREHLLSPG